MISLVHGARAIAIVMSDPLEGPEDSLVALRAQLDQMIAMSPELARVAKGAYDAYMGEGFTAGQALFLTAVQLKDQPFGGP